ncbi:MAG: DUF938 domain-containing protein [Methylococcaceae bacterium]|nr:DUF938 domain-containing protein [Methylococcaceae bacterium]
MIEPSKPYAPSCDRNRDAIAEVLRRHLTGPASVLEIGSGTGQHAVHFAGVFPHLHWQCSDRGDCLSGIRAWLAEAGLANAPEPLELDVGGSWPERRYDAVFSANTLHIMSWGEVEQMFAGMGQVLNPAAVVIVYGPFNYGGTYTSESNARFDVWLKERGAHQGIRDFEAVQRLAAGIGLELLEDAAMPANNRCLVWRWTDGRRVAAEALNP